MARRMRWGIGVFRRTISVSPAMARETAIVSSDPGIDDQAPIDAIDDAAQRVTDDGARVVGERHADEHQESPPNPAAPVGI
jgi:hypothetical protein